MKNLKCFILILILSFFISENLCSQDRWWQREIPAPSSNQMINPNYLSKKRDLEQTLDKMNSLARDRNKYASAGQTDAVKSADEMLQFMGEKMNTLEYELSKISMYVINPNFNNQNNTIQNTNQQKTVINTSSGSNKTSSSASNSYLLTLYKIQNCDRNSFESDYKYNEESLIVYNELKNNISQIVKSETNISSSSISFIREKVKYYEIFLSNWGNGQTIGTKEALKEIDKLNNEIQNKEKHELLRKTGININYKFIGNLPEPILVKYKRGHKCSMHFNAYMVVECAEIKSFNKTYECKEYHLDYNSGEKSFNEYLKWIKYDKLHLTITYGIKQVPLNESGIYKVQWLNQYQSKLEIPISLGQIKDLDILLYVSGKNIIDFKIDE